MTTYSVVGTRHDGAEVRWTTDHFDSIESLADALVESDPTVWAVSVWDGDGPLSGEPLFTIDYQNWCPGCE